MRSLLTLLLSRLNTLSSFSSSIPFPWTHSSASISFLWWGDKNWTQDYRRSLTSAKHRSIITVYVCLWPHYCWYKPGCSWPSWPPGYVVHHFQSQILYCWAALKVLCPKPVALRRFVVTHVQDMTFGHDECDTIEVDLDPACTDPLQSLPTLRNINTPTQPVSSSNWLKDHSIHFTKSLRY